MLDAFAVAHATLKANAKRLGAQETVTAVVDATSTVLTQYAEDHKDDSKDKMRIPEGSGCSFRSNLGARSGQT